MSNAEEPKLSPEAIKMLNELAAKRSDEIELTPEARENLAKLGNFHLTHTYKAYKNSYAIMTAVFSAVTAGVILYVLNEVLAHPDALEDLLFVLPLAGGFAAILAFIAFRMWQTYKRL